jgi:hypothetical protein
MAVEAKSTPLIAHIYAHIERIGFLREYLDRKGDARRCQGALAGIVISGEVRDFALKKGLFLIEPSGKTSVITAPPAVKSW